MIEPKPFDLEKWQRGDHVQFRDGGKCRVLMYVPEAKPAEQLIVLCEDEPNKCSIVTRHANGAKLSEGYGTCASDVVMAPRTRRVVVRLYKRINSIDCIALVDAQVSTTQPQWTLIDEWTKEVPE